MIRAYAGRIIGTRLLDLASLLEMHKISENRIARDIVMSSILRRECVIEGCIGYTTNVRGVTPSPWVHDPCYFEECLMCGIKWRYSTSW